MLSRYSLPVYAQYTEETNTLRSAKAFAVFWSLYCSKQHSTSANDVVVPAAKMPSSTRAGDRANYENGMSVRWKKKSTGLLGKERAEGPEKFPLPRICEEYNAQRAIPTDIAISWILTVRRRVRSLRARGVVDRYSWHVEYPVAHCRSRLSIIYRRDRYCPTRRGIEIRRFIVSRSRR